MLIWCGIFVSKDRPRPSTAYIGPSRTFQESSRAFKASFWAERHRLEVRHEMFIRKNLTLPTIHQRPLKLSNIVLNKAKAFWPKKESSSANQKSQAWLIFPVSPSQPPKPQYVMSSTKVSPAKKYWVDWVYIFGIKTLPTDTFSDNGSWMGIFGKDLRQVWTKN